LTGNGIPLPSRPSRISGTNSFRRAVYGARPRDGDQQLHVDLRLVVHRHAGLAERRDLGCAGEPGPDDPVGLCGRSARAQAEEDQDQPGSAEDRRRECEPTEQDRLHQTDDQEDRGEDDLEDAGPDQPLPRVAAER
jgi:hypothetical protein